MNNSVLLSVMMPVWNEAATLREIVAQVRVVPLDHELIIVDNCSTDDTRAILDELVQSGDASYVTAQDEAREARIRVVLQSENGGKGTSVRHALDLAQGEFVIVQDADLEYDPQDFLKLMAVMQRRHVDVVYGTRLNRGAHANAQPKTSFFYGRVGLSIFFRLLYASPLNDVATCYKLMRRDVARSLDLRGSGFELDFEIPAKMRRRGFRFAQVPISYRPRTELEGKKIRVVHDGLRAVWTLLKYRFVR